jgi:hypothetical protein
MQAMRYRISPDCVLDIQEEFNEYIISWLGEGEHFPWHIVLGDMSKGATLSGACPKCGENMARVATGYCPSPLCGDGGFLDVCMPCKLQTNYVMTWIS